jgi:hypothetical protein
VTSLDTVVHSSSSPLPGTSFPTPVFVSHQLPHHAGIGTGSLQWPMSRMGVCSKGPPHFSVKESQTCLLVSLPLQHLKCRLAISILQIPSGAQCRYGVSSRSPQSPRREDGHANKMLDWLSWPPTARAFRDHRSSAQMINLYIILA